MQCAYSFKVFLLNYSEVQLLTFILSHFFVCFMLGNHLRNSVVLQIQTQKWYLIFENTLLPIFELMYFLEVLISILLTSRCKSYMPLLQSLLALLGPACQTYPAIMVCILLAYILLGKKHTNCCRKCNETSVEQWMCIARYLPMGFYHVV